MRVFILFLLFFSASLVTSAQMVGYHLIPNTQEQLSVQVRENLDTKLTQGLSKAGCLVGGVDGVFVVESKMTMGDVMSVDEGGVEVSNGRGEITILVKNRIDGSVYHSAVIPVRGNVVGGTEALQLDMIKRIKSADPVFTKFAATSRAKIVAFYKSNCTSIMQKAETYYRSKEYDKCIEYLKVVPESVGCYEQVAFLIEMCNSAEK